MSPTEVKTNVALMFLSITLAKKYVLVLFVCLFVIVQNIFKICLKLFLISRTKTKTLFSICELHNSKHFPLLKFRGMCSLHGHMHSLSSLHLFVFQKEDCPNKFIMPFTFCIVSMNHSFS